MVCVDAVAIVAGKCVVAIVVALAHGDDRGQEAVPGRITVGVELLADHVSERVDREGRVVQEDQPKHAADHDA